MKAYYRAYYMSKIQCSVIANIYGHQVFEHLLQHRCGLGSEVLRE